MSHYFIVKVKGLKLPIAVLSEVYIKLVFNTSINIYDINFGSKLK